MGKRFNMRLLSCLLAGCMLLALSGCGQKKSVVIKKDGTYLYYLSKEGSSLLPVEYEFNDNDTDAAVEDLLYHLMNVDADEKPQGQCALPENVRILSYDLTDGVLTIDFSAEYHRLEKTREVLTRAAFVRTLLQVGEIENVCFTIDGSPATDASGNVIGMMNTETFVENAKQINAYQHVAINLYFTDDSGTMLKKESRSIYYSSSKPLEWAIVERLIAGPKVAGNKATIPASTQILSVTNSEETCYVNLSKSFLTDALSVDEEIPIYSIVNSICDNCKSVKKVQFSIESDTDVTFRENMTLSKVYVPETSLLETKEDLADSQ